ncbi:Trm112 family protein [Azospirillum sp. 11R-A]|uniref:Trm112 family protein n=1 Tax=Azospirillum sp. 11R-A TaxID=3111634 RepID=UPI003C1BB5CA
MATPEDKSSEAKTNARVDPKLLEILVCPLTKGPLRYDAERGELVSERAGLAYPIRDGIPIMLIDEARSLDKVGAAR